MNGATRENGQDAGFALIAVVSFLLIAASVAVPFFSNARIEAFVTRNRAQEVRDRAILPGMIELAAFRYMELHTAGQPEMPVHVTCEFGEGASATFRFQDHSGLVDLNAASADLLALGLEASGIEHGDASLIATELLRYRSVLIDRAPASGAGERSVWGGYKHGLFESAAELLDFELPHGVGLEALRSVFTTHSGSGAIDQDRAPAALRSLLIGSTTAELPFVVKGGRRMPALTVSVVLHGDGDQAVFGTATFAPLGIARRMTMIEPLRMSRGTRKVLMNTNGSGIACDLFFRPEMIALLRETSS